MGESMRFEHVDTMRRTQAERRVTADKEECV